MNNETRILLQFWDFHGLNVDDAWNLLLWDFHGIYFWDFGILLSLIRLVVFMVIHFLTHVHSMLDLRRVW